MAPGPHVLLALAQPPPSTKTFFWFPKYARLAACILAPACCSLPHSSFRFSHGWLFLITDFSACVTSSGKPSLISESKLAPFFQPRHFPLGTPPPPKTHGTNWSYLVSRCTNMSLSVLHPPLDWAQVRIFLTCPLRASVPHATPSIEWMNEMQAVIWYYVCLEMFNKQWKIKITSALWCPAYLPPGQTICSSCVALHEC